jgi:nucleotide-binding universal stress UspA family protein
MYKKIMVPLDGSELAECVLPHVEFVVKGCNAPVVTFVRVVEPVRYPMGAVTDGASVYTELDAERDREKAEEYNRKEAEQYLNRIVNEHQYAGVDVKPVLLTGRAAESLADYAEKNEIELIVIATHGRSGISRWVWGSTADKILRSSCVPVLMVRAPGCVPGV